MPGKVDEGDILLYLADRFGEQDVRLVINGKLKGYFAWSKTARCHERFSDPDLWRMFGAETPEILGDFVAEEITGLTIKLASADLV